MRQGVLLVARELLPTVVERGLQFLGVTVVDVVDDRIGVDWVVLVQAEGQGLPYDGCWVTPIVKADPDGRPVNGGWVLHIPEPVVLARKEAESVA